MYPWVLLVHLLGASIWIGGHLILLFRYVPSALWKKDLKSLQEFENRFEVIGIPALAIQILTGIWMGLTILPFSGWFDFSNPISRVLGIKLSLLLLTAVLAVDARLRVIPRLTEKNVTSLVWHIVPVTLISVLFAVAGLLFRWGGW